MTTANGSIDELDANLIDLFDTEPRIGIFEASRRLGVARGTVQARLDRLQRQGVIRGFSLDIDAAALGYPVACFIEVEIEQSARTAEMQGALGSIPEVIEAHTITGRGDLMVRVVAASNTDLQRVIDKLNRVEGVSRTSTLVVLETLIAPRALPLVRAAARDEVERSAD